MDQRAQSSSRSLGLRLAILVAIATTTTGIALANHQIAGLYHDDGIYLSTARSLAEQGSYRLINLPGAPFATKYPPLYPLILAVIWKVAPGFPDNLRLMKAVNAALLGGVALFTYLWLGRLPHLGQPMRLMIAALTSFSPGLFYFCDLVLTEMLFTLFVLGVFLFGAERRTQAVTRGELVAGFLAGFAVLTLTIGIAVVAGLVWHIWARHGWRRAARAAVPGVVLSLCWTVWRLAATSDGGELLDYYVGYERSVWSMLLEDPWLATRILALNARYYVETAPLVFGWPGWVAVLLATVLLVAASASAKSRSQLALPVRICAVYCVLLLGHPLPLERYLTPFVPLAYAGLGMGAGHLASVRLWRPLAIWCLAPFVFVNVVWVQHFGWVTQTRLHGQHGRALTYGWEGFRETADWLVANTPRTTVLATGSDLMYFLYTGRKCIRPWPARPQFYSPAYGVAPRVPDGTEISSELRRFGVDYLVVDPMFSDGEGKYARAVIDAILADPSAEWREVFRTMDGAHRVYQRIPGR
jgi:hypothetical protein